MRVVSDCVVLCKLKKKSRKFDEFSRSLIGKWLSEAARNACRRPSTGRVKVSRMCGSLVRHFSAFTVSKRNGSIERNSSWLHAGAGSDTADVRVYPSRHPAAHQALS